MDAVGGVDAGAGDAASLAAGALYAGDAAGFDAGATAEDAG